MPKRESEFRQHEFRQDAELCFELGIQRDWQQRNPERKFEHGQRYTNYSDQSWLQPASNWQRDSILGKHRNRRRADDHDNLDNDTRLDKQHSDPTRITGANDFHACQNGCGDSGGHSDQTRATYCYTCWQT